MTFQFQESLPHLPIPDLNDTCRNYLTVLRPLQTDHEFKNTESAVESFLQLGQGEFLDHQLREYAELRNSYIEQFWYDSYLKYDSPVVLNLNPFFLLEDDPFTSELSHFTAQVKRASSLVLSALKFVRAIKHETLLPDVMKNGKPLCMYQYSKLFGASRIPSDEGCIMQSDPHSKHIVVLSRSQFYWFDVMDLGGNPILLEHELCANFTSIIADSQNATPKDIAKSSMGVLTTENRRAWNDVRRGISGNATNSEILSIVDRALFILCLDDVEISNLSELAQNMLCGISNLDRGIQVGTCTNRWYDKLQIIVTKNAKAGVNFEHTGVDGHTVLRFVSDVYTDSILSFARSINTNAPSLWASKPASTLLCHAPSTQDELEKLITIPRKLDWDVTPDLSLALRFGETRLSDLISQNEFKHLEFKQYGSLQIKKMNFSPDAFVQMAFQATYYALYGKVECTYEPAMTKQYFHARTEAIRPVSVESNLFVRKFFEESIPNKLKLKYLADACAAHSEQVKRCSQGKGVDRHLYALFCMWGRYVESHETPLQPMTTGLHSSGDDTLSEWTITDSPFEHKTRQIPEIFADAGWDKLNNTIISTSNCGNPALRLFGFGPVSPQGFGIGYIIKDDSISICASSKHRQTERFLVTLESYFNEILNIFEQVQASSVATSTANTTLRADRELREAIQRLDLRRGPSKSNLATLLGGYSYFDRGEEDIKSRGHTPEPPFLSRANSSYSIREIGKKMRLSEY